MAKGNDGNYLQHNVEVAAAVHLAMSRPRGRLHVALTHGMSPFEACGELPDGQTRKLLRNALEAAGKPPEGNEESIVTAYRATNATREHYPNTAELLRGMFGGDHLLGGITEIDSQKYSQLRDAWLGTEVMVVQSSWRNEVREGGALWSPHGLDAPWLFSMDPMTYREDGYCDDNNLYKADIEQLSNVVKSYVASGQPGMVALFVYAVRPDVQPLFWDFVDSLAVLTKTTVTSCWLTHQGGNRNLAGLLSSAITLPSDWLPHGINPGR